MEITQVYKEKMPKVKLVGKRYSNKDRDESGTFAKFWQQCFEENWLNTLKKCDSIPIISDDLVGAMRMCGKTGDFEYWIGVFLADTASVPDGFEGVEINAGEIGVCLLYGNDKNGELYSIEASDMAMVALDKKGWKFSDKGWFFERYNNKRFTTPDEKGNVILDICAYLI